MGPSVRTCSPALRVAWTFGGVEGWFPESGPGEGGQRHSELPGIPTPPASFTVSIFAFCSANSRLGQLATQIPLDKSTTCLRRARGGEPAFHRESRKGAGVFSRLSFQIPLRILPPF